MASKGRLAVQKLIIEVIKEALNAIQLSGFSVVEFASPVIYNLDKCITLQLLRERRLGWQGNSYSPSMISGKLLRKDEWLSQQHWQLQVLLRRDENVAEDTVVAEDIADMLIAWFNGPGIQSFLKRGLAPERIDETAVLIYNDNSDLYQKRGVFTVRIQVPKELTTGENSLDLIKPDVKPI